MLSKILNKKDELCQELFALRAQMEGKTESRKFGDLQSWKSSLFLDLK